MGGREKSCGDATSSDAGKVPGFRICRAPHLFPELFWDIPAAFKLARLVQLGKLPVCWSPGRDRAINIRLRGATKI